MDVSIIIVNYNTKEFTKRCIESIRAFTLEIKYEIILIDNNSSDGSIEYFQNEKDLVFFPLKENLGFGGGNNFGASHATGKYLFLLNPDTSILNNVVKIFYEYMEINSDKVGVVGAVLQNTEREEGLSFSKFRSLSNHIELSVNKLIKKAFRRKETKYHIPKNDIFEVDSVLGADIFITKCLFDRVSGFDPDFFLYVEEVDLQKRISKLGYKRVIIRGPKIIHFEGGSSSKNGGMLTFRNIYRLENGSLIFVKKHYSIAYYRTYIFLQWITWLPWIMIDSRFSIKEKKESISLLLKSYK